jgi:hypothetical protein
MAPFLNSLVNFIKNDVLTDPSAPAHWSEYLERLSQIHENLANKQFPGDYFTTELKAFALRMEKRRGMKFNDFFPHPAYQNLLASVSLIKSRRLQ